MAIDFDSAGHKNTLTTSSSTWCRVEIDDLYIMEVLFCLVWFCFLVLWHVPRFLILSSFLLGCKVPLGSKKCLAAAANAAFFT